MIAGTAALKLPPMPKTTILVTLTKSEKKAYLASRCLAAKDLNFSALTYGHLAVGSASSLDMRMHKLRLASNCVSKLKALETDIKSLLIETPGCNVLVFTRFTDSIASLKAFAEKSKVMKKMEWYQISSGVSAVKRQKSIRNFQDENNKKSKLLVVSYKTGQCGITLTAASRVYLLEPCLLASDETQAGGRISRLGQTKQISLVKLVSKDTVDEGIVEFHQKLVSGALKLGPNGNLPKDIYPMFLAKGSTTPPKPVIITKTTVSNLYNAMPSVTTMVRCFSPESYAWQALYKTGGFVAKQGDPTYENNLYEKAKRALYG